MSPWEAIDLLSVIDELALKKAIPDIVNEEKEFTDEQKYINTHEQAILFEYNDDKSLKKN